MEPDLVDDAGFDRFVSDHDTAVIGFIEDDGDAAAFSALADVLGKRPGVAFGRVCASSRGLFAMFGLTATAVGIFRRRIAMYLEPGLPDAGRLTQLLDAIDALDIERVRSEIEQERCARESLAVHRVCPATRRGKLN